MEKNQYQIQYTDNTYRLIDWTEKEFKKVCRRLFWRFSSVSLKDGVFSLKDVRAIVFIPPVPEQTEEEQKQENQLTEWGFVDDETAIWLKNNGIDLMGGDK